MTATLTARSYFHLVKVVPFVMFTHRTEELKALKVTAQNSERRIESLTKELEVRSSRWKIIALYLWCACVFSHIVKHVCLDILVCICVFTYCCDCVSRRQHGKTGPRRSKKRSLKFALIGAIVGH